LIPIEEFSNQAAGLSRLVFGALLILVFLIEPRGLLQIGRRLPQWGGQQ